MQFHKVLDNVELIMYMRFLKTLMTGCGDMDKIHKSAPQIDFFVKNRALSLPYPYGTLT